MKKLFKPFKSSHLDLNNHIAMAPLTRSRAIGNLPNDLMATYYGQRASAGLIVAEGTSPSVNGLGYPNIPGVFSNAQVEGWKKITKSVHDKGGKIFLQLMHTGRVAHELNLPEGGEVIAPSAIPAVGEMFTFEGVKPNSTPRAMTLEDINKTQEEFVQAAKNAIEAGFDGVEIHSANGYLLNQFINKGSNHRTDEYGGSVENRSRFTLEIVDKIVEAIGADKTSIRFSPYGVFNDMAAYDEIDATYQYLVDELNKYDLAYLHLIDVNAFGAFQPEGFLEKLVENYNGAVLFNGGMAYNLDRSEALVNKKDNYFVSVGAPYVSNPDLVERLEKGAELAQPDQATFYTPGEEGYTTYPAMNA